MSAPKWSDPAFVKAYNAKYYAANAARIKSAVKRYRKDNSETVRARAAKYRNEHRAEHLATLKSYRKANRARVDASIARWHKAHPERTRAAALAWYYRNPDKCNEAKARRRAIEKRVTPAWRDRARILEVYALAKRLTKTLGIKHHVDHIVPLRSALVCGLHVEHNLRVIPAAENRSKNNRYWPDMPKANGCVVVLSGNVFVRAAA